MINAAEFKPGQHTLAAAGLLFVQGMDDWQFNCHASEYQSESTVTIVFPSGAYASPPTILYASVVQALQLLQARNEETAIMKATNDTRMQALQKEEMIVERCCTALQNAAHKALKARYMTIWGVWNCWDASLVDCFLEAWGSPQDIRDRSPGSG